MIQRCTNPQATSYDYYGGRGVTVCRKWRDSFAAFFAHVGLRPGNGWSLDRWPDNRGNYKPGNVRWATAKQQAENRVYSSFVRIHSINLKTQMDTLKHLTHASHQIDNKCLRRTLGQLIAKVRWPMAEILALVPGNRIVDRARAIGISRQTYYQWLAEEVRPTGPEAQSLADLTGVSLAIISATPENDDDAGTEAQEASGGVEEDGARVPGGAVRLRSGRGGVQLKYVVRRDARKVRRRIVRRPGEERPA